MWYNRPHQAALWLQVLDLQGLWGIMEYCIGAEGCPKSALDVFLSSSVLESLTISKGVLFVVMHVSVLVNYELDGNIYFKS